RELVDYSGDGSAVAEDVEPATRHRSDLQLFFDNGEIVGEDEAVEQRMGAFDAGIEHGDADVFSGPLFEEGTRGFDRWPRGRHALVQPTVWPRSRNSIKRANKAAAIWTRARCSGRKPGGSGSVELGRLS